ncbi:hypothetical protein H4R34_001037 [Dimargaris verticillata]|uniref:Uncharacterized protein n=1 Tax=Dimargaris verticillata TaxID=2761393 RepID=A0A9W8EAN9_9FUNG|nr:hypothetical protein H4R34_001037 [Dimargaris verticillata]
MSHTHQTFKSQGQQNPASATNPAVVPIDMDLLIQKMSAINQVKATETRRASRPTVHFASGTGGTPAAASSPPFHSDATAVRPPSLRVRFDDRSGAPSAAPEASATHPCDLELHGEKLSPLIMVALRNRSEEMHELVQRNRSLFREIRSVLQGTDHHDIVSPVLASPQPLLSPAHWSGSSFGGGGIGDSQATLASPISPYAHSLGHSPIFEKALNEDTFDAFKRILYTPRADMPDPVWLRALAGFLAKVPPLWSRFQDLIGYEPALWEDTASGSIYESSSEGEELSSGEMDGTHNKYRAWAVPTQRDYEHYGQGAMPFAPEDFPEHPESQGQLTDTSKPGDTGPTLPTGPIFPLHRGESPTFASQVVPQPSGRSTWPSSRRGSILGSNAMDAQVELEAAQDAPGLARNLHQSTDAFGQNALAVDPSWDLYQQHQPHRRDSEFITSANDEDDGTDAGHYNGLSGPSPDHRRRSRRPSVISPGISAGQLIPPPPSSLVVLRQCPGAMDTLIATHQAFFESLRAKLAASEEHHSPRTCKFTGHYDQEQVCERPQDYNYKELFNVLRSPPQTMADEPWLAYLVDALDQWPEMLDRLEDMADRALGHGQHEL